MSTVGHMTIACPVCQRPLHIDVGVAPRSSHDDYLPIAPIVDETRRCPEPQQQPLAQAA